MKRQEGMGSTRGAGHTHRGTVCERPLVGSHLLGEARLGTGRIHSLVNRWIPWCHSEPAAAPAGPDKEEETTGYTEQLRAHQLYNSQLPLNRVEQLNNQL